MSDQSLLASKVRTRWVLSRRSRNTTVINAYWHLRLGHCSLFPRSPVEQICDQRLLASKVRTPTSILDTLLVASCDQRLLASKVRTHGRHCSILGRKLVINAYWHLRLGHSDRSNLYPIIALL